MKEQTLAVQQMQDYIEQHLSEDTTLAALANVSHYSPWHYYRLFREYLGLTPAEYIRRLRLSRSAIRFKRERCHIIDVAFDLGFGSVTATPAHFFGSSAAIPAITPATLFRSRFSSPMASNSESPERKQWIWKTCKVCLFRSFKDRRGRRSLSAASKRRTIWNTATRWAATCGDC